MTTRKSLSFGGGLSYRKQDNGGQKDSVSNSESEDSVEGDGNPVNSPEFLSSDPSSPARARPAAHHPTGNVTPRRQENTDRNRRKGRTPPPTVPMADKMAQRRQLAEVLANQKQILKRMAKLETMMSDLKNAKQQTRREKQQKLEVPNDVRIMVKQAYDHVINNDGRAKWATDKGMKATLAVNMETTQAIHDHVKGLLPDYGEKILLFNAAVDTYFGSKQKQDKREAEGKAAKHKKQCTRNSRKAQKMKNRLKALRAKQSYTQKKKEDMQRVLQGDFMSSEESDVDDDGVKVYKTRAIPWESDAFGKLKQALDTKYSAIQSDQARRQCIKRIQGPPSTSNLKKPKLSEQDAWITK
ncbi:uncharacterized protein LOC118403889 [Branchiostoma floridae]|uniref:Uncharacterized protein LOC118403889 n=1 Tax=Branchiostoma floridae TaxID=7739 RepID=A0A9J7HI19_BRAFL|nr:uncharacterized protein LOC118403889 [Branchiostoma floridae]